MGSNETNIPIEVNVSGGTIYGKNFSLGGIHGGSPPVDSDAVWNVSGTAAIDFSNGGGYIGGWHPDALDSTGTLNMSGDATFLASGFFLSAQGNGFVTLADNAKITVLGNHYDSLNAFITSGNITAAAGGGVNVSYDSDLDQTLIALGAAGGGLSGDYNGDGDGEVDAADYTVYQDNLGGDSSVLNVLGDASLAGTLSVSLIDGFTPGGGNTFKVLTASGELTDLGLTLGGPDAGLFSMSIDAANDWIMLMTAGAGLAGDYSGNGVVDAADYTVRQDNLGLSASALNGNGSGAATVVQADYLL